MLIEKILYGFSTKTAKEVLAGIAGIAATILIHLSIGSIRPIVVTTRLGSDLFESLIVSPYNVEETPVVVLFGILLFFLKTKLQKVCLIGLVALLSQSRLLAELCFSTPMNVFFNGPQFFMIFAIPIISLYNGKRGSENKGKIKLFYCYYPLHWYAIAIIKSFWIG